MFEWLPAHINATQKKDGHTVLSPIVSELVFQWAWRRHQGPMSPTQPHCAATSPETMKKMGRNEDTQMFLARSADEQTSVRVAKSDRNATAVCAACT